jgi:hypothetical protein
MLKYIFSALLWLLMFSPASWAKTRFLPTGIQLSTDVFRPLYYGFYEKTGVQWELNGAIDFARVMLEGDYGWGEIIHKGFNESVGVASGYANKGNYFRIGLNLRLNKDTPNKNIAFLGVRYAMSFFNDTLKSRVTYVYNPDKEGSNKYQSVVEDGPSIDDQQNNVQARWFEAVSGIKVKVWKALYVGITVRYKFGLKVERANSYVPFEILGWGLNDEEAFGFNYYLSLRIPLVSDAQEPNATPAPSN